MTFRRLAAIALGFLVTTVAWGVLGTSLVERGGEFDSKPEQKMHRLWGAPHRQVAAGAWIEIEDTRSAQLREDAHAGRI